MPERARGISIKEVVEDLEEDMEEMYRRCADRGYDVPDWDDVCLWEALDDLNRFADHNVALAAHELKAVEMQVEELLDDKEED